MNTITGFTQNRKHTPSKEQLLIIMVIVVYLFGTLIHSSGSENSDKIAVLGFHNVVSDQVKQEQYAYNMWVDSESSFREKIAYLHEQGYEAWTLKQLYEWKCGNIEKPKKVVVLTFDDGYKASETMISPILKEYGYRGATFVIGSNLTNPKKADSFLSLNDIRKKDSTMEYYSHTYKLHYRKNHKFAVDIVSEEQLKDDLIRQQQIVDCSYVAYPYGHYHEGMAAILKEHGVKMAFGYHENRKAERFDDFYRIPRFSINAYTSLDTMKAMLESD
ncbi:MAG: polysaccharide deacetylase family protein [Erysipelotrichaceae bacterium]|nr:polysaccharide deacetylase family protein [Erysipelotrichaceae bacterium]